MPPDSEKDAAEFGRLKAQLQALWSDVFPGDDVPYTSVVVPSINARGTLAHGDTYLEERLLFLMIRLRNPFARLVYVTSQPIDPAIVDYYLQLLVGTPASHARGRLTLLAVHDASPRPLTEKLLERPRMLQRIRAAIRDPARAYLTVPHSTPLERTLTLALGIPLNAPDPALMWMGTKSAGRRLLREAGLRTAAGAEDLRSEDDLVAALEDLRRRRPSVRAAVLKIDDGLGGEANALFRYPDGAGDVRAALPRVTPTSPAVSASDFLDAFVRAGGVVEELLDGSETSSPSVQLRINPHSEVFVTSTHEQLLGGPVGQLYRGCEFPAHGAYREYLQVAGVAVGRVLAARGVIGRCSVDFVCGSGDGETDQPVAVDLNLRMGGTTHPMLALRSLTGGRYDRETGLFHDLEGRAKFYRATDHLESPAYRRLVPEDVVEILTLNRLCYDHRGMTGVVFHMLGGVSEYGRLGLVAIGDSRAQARELYARAAEVLDREAGPAGA